MSTEKELGNTITGTIEVIIEDKHGNFKRRACVHNNLTQAALSQMLCAGLGSTNSLNELFRIQKSPSTGQHVKVADSSPIHLYCLTDPVTISSRQIYRHYLKSSQTSLYQTSPSDTSKVPFYTDSESELTQLTPHPRNCAMVGNSPKFTFEYRTDPEASVDGYIRGILIGVPPFDTNSYYDTPRPLGIRTTPRSPKLPFTDAGLQNPHYAIQHHLHRGTPHTVIWKPFIPSKSTISTFDSTTEILSKASFPDFFLDGDYDFSGGLICPGDPESLTYTVVKAFLKGAETLPPVADPSSFSVQVTLADTGSGYAIDDTFSILDDAILCTVTSVDDGAITGFITDVINPAVNPLGTSRSLQGCPTETETGTGSGATVNIQVQATPNSDFDDWQDTAITTNYTDSGFKIILAWRTDITGDPSPTVIKKILVPAEHPTGMRTTPVLVWHDGEQPRIEIFYTRDQDETTGMFRLFRVTVDPYLLGNDSNAVVHSSEQYVGLLPYIIGHKSPRIDGQRYVHGFYDSINEEYYFPIAQRVSNDIFIEVGLPGMLQGIRVKPKSGVENAPAITIETIRSFELFASDYNISDIDVGNGLASDPGTYQFTNLRGGAGQMSLYGSQPHKAIQYVNLDYVWSGATFATPIEKDEDDLLRVIYSFELGNK